jgi:transcription initiation factor TFIID subunit 9B
MATTSTPRDAKIMALLLSALDLEEYEDNVIHILLAFMKNYTSTVLTESVLLSQHSGRGGLPLEVSDVVLAISQVFSN